MELSVSRAPILTVEVVPTLPPHVTGTGVALITGAAAGLWSFGVGHRGIPKIHGHLKRNHSHDGSGYGAAFFFVPMCAMDLPSTKNPSHVRIKKKHTSTSISSWIRKMGSVMGYGKMNR